MALVNQVEQPSALSFFYFSYRFTSDRGLNVLCFHVYVYIHVEAFCSEVLGNRQDEGI